jgi:hypothetical protein
MHPARRLGCSSQLPSTVLEARVHRRDYAEPRWRRQHRSNNSSSSSCINDSAGPRSHSRRQSNNNNKESCLLRTTDDADPSCRTELLPPQGAEHP